jgi:hypothetical protein
LPDFHLIQLQVWLVLEVMFIGMENETAAYTPYLAKLKANAAYYTQTQEN